jgi:predicted transcriptional regulator
MLHYASAKSRENFRIIDTLVTWCYATIMPRKTPLGVSLSPELLTKLLTLVKADDRGRTRNELIGEAVEQYCRRELRQLADDEQRMAKLAKLVGMVGEFRDAQTIERDSHTP